MLRSLVLSTCLVLAARAQLSPTSCDADSSKCSSVADDCCACDASIGMTGCGFSEPATCRDGYVPRIISASDTSSCYYECVPPTCTAGTSLLYVAVKRGYYDALAYCSQIGGVLAPGTYPGLNSWYNQAWSAQGEIWIGDSGDGGGPLRYATLFDTCYSGACPCTNCADASEMKAFACSVRDGDDPRYQSYSNTVMGRPPPDGITCESTAHCPTSGACAENPVCWTHESPNGHHYCAEQVTPGSSGTTTDICSNPAAQDYIQCWQGKAQRYCRHSYDSGDGDSPAATVITSFSLAGAVEDFGPDEQAAIVAVLATGAGVPTSAVSLTLSPGSVLVRAEILLKDDATATAAENALSGANGILENAASLQAALIAQFQADGIDTTDLTVEGLVQAPPPSPPGSPGDGGGGGSCGVGCIVGIVFGVFALLALSALLFLFLTGAACFKKVDGGYATGKPGAAGAAEAAEAA